MSEKAQHFAAEGLVPRDKFDIDAVRAVADAGYPAIAPVLDELLDWTADSNWPVARPLADVLVTVGEPLVARSRGSCGERTGPTRNTAYG